MSIRKDIIIAVSILLLIFISACVKQEPTGYVTGETTTALQPTTTLIATIPAVTTVTVASATSTTIKTEPTATTTTSTTTTITSTISTGIVSNVIDGDTIELQNGEKVRLLGINTPERGQFYYIEATEKLRELVEGKPIRLEKDVSDKDQYGRLLRYIHVDNIFVNLEMVKEGHAHVYFISPNTKYINLFTEAEMVAKNAEKGIWQFSALSECIGISYFHWNAEGDDCKNLNDEYVIFSNSCSYSVNMNRWSVKDEATHIYTFSDFTLAAASSVTLYTGSGTDTSTELYWDSSGKSCNAIWNNDGDTLYIRDEAGKLILTYSYP